MSTNRLEQELKRGSAELLVLALLEQQERYGYEISRLINERSERRHHLSRDVALSDALSPGSKGLIEGRWVEKAGQRRRRSYRLTPGGRGVLPSSDRSGESSSPRSIASPGFAAA